MKSWEYYTGYEDLLPNHVLIQRVAQAAGVSTESVNRVAKKRAEREGRRDRKWIYGCPYTFISVSLWDDYMQVGKVQRVAKRPKGWLSVKTLVNEGLGSKKLYKRIKSGELEAVYVGNILYIEPGAAQCAIAEQRNRRAPPGWVAVTEVCTRSGRSKQALSSYIKSHNFPVKYFLHATRDQLVQYIRTEDSERYLGCSR